MADSEQIEIARIGDSISIGMEAQICKNKPTGMFSMSRQFQRIEIDVTTSNLLGSDVDAVGLARKEIQPASTGRRRSAPSKE